MIQCCLIFRCARLTGWRRRLGAAGIRKQSHSWGPTSVTYVARHGSSHGWIHPRRCLRLGNSPSLAPFDACSACNVDMKRPKYCASWFCLNVCYLEALSCTFVGWFVMPRLGKYRSPRNTTKPRRRILTPLSTYKPWHLQEAKSSIWMMATQRSRFQSCSVESRPLGPQSVDCWPPLWVYYEEHGTPSAIHRGWRLTLDKYSTQWDAPIHVDRFCSENIMIPTGTYHASTGLVRGHVFWPMRRRRTIKGNFAEHDFGAELFLSRFPNMEGPRIQWRWRVGVRCYSRVYEGTLKGKWFVRDAGIIIERWGRNYVDVSLASPTLWGEVENF